MASKGSGVVGRKGGFLKEGRIGEYAIERLFGAKILYILLHDFYALTEGTLGYIFPRLNDCLRVDFHPNNLRLGRTLRCHEGEDTTTRPYVEDVARFGDVCPCSEQHAVGAHLLGTLAVVDCELLECEHSTKIMRK